MHSIILVIPLASLSNCTHPTLFQFATQNSIFSNYNSISERVSERFYKRRIKKKGGKKEGAWRERDEIEKKGKVRLKKSKREKRKEK